MGNEALKGLLIEARLCSHLACRAISAKLGVLLSGESRGAAPTCQIPDLKQKYRDLGLPDRKGVFVEVGAYDGESFSNTSFLADQGWRGVYVEPIPQYYRRMRLRHALNDVAGENVCIAEDTGLFEISVMGALSTLNAPTAAHYAKLSWARSLAGSASPLMVRGERLQTVLARHDVPLSFDLMVIDVEGGEEPIVRQLLASAWRPAVLIVELIDGNPDFASDALLVASAAKARSSLLEDGYEEVHVDGINTIFVRRVNGP